jgi:RNA polymerase sigma-70 factor (ECF subfamily)
VNEALARLRRKRLPTTDADEVEGRSDPRDEPEIAVESGELQEFLARQIRMLEPDYRVPLVLRDVVGLSNEEVAEVLELSIAATKSRIHRARMQLRAAYVEWERTTE